MPVWALGGLRRIMKILRIDTKPTVDRFNARVGFGWFETSKPQFTYKTTTHCHGFNARVGFGWFETAQSQAFCGQTQ